MLGGTYRVIGTIESYRRSMHTDFFGGTVYWAIKDISHITSYRDAIGAPCIRALVCIVTGAMMWVGHNKWDTFTR